MRFGLLIARLSPYALFSLLTAIFLAACSPQEKSAKLLIELPEPTEAQKAAVASDDLAVSSSGWTKNLVTQDDVFCYALLIGAPDLNGTQCTNSNGTLVADVGGVFGTYPAGDTLEVSVPPGSARTLYLVGVNADALSKCSSFKLDGTTQSGYSRPHIIAKTTVDLVPGDNVINMVTQVSGSMPFEKCQSAGQVTPPPSIPSGYAVATENLPVGPSNVTSLDIKVGGSGVTKYRYKVSSSTSCTDETGYSSEIPVNTNIPDDISAYSEGGVTLCLVGYDGTKWQSFAEATEYTWVKDTTPPSTLSMTINGGISYTTSTSVALAINASEAHAMTVGTDYMCSGTFEPFSATKTWTLSANATHTLYVMVKDEAGNASGCISGGSITHDGLNPNEPSGLTLGSVPPSVTTTPVITFVDENDNGPAGIAKFQAQIHLASDDSVVQAWQDLASGNAVTGLTLTDGQDYYAKIRAVDNAGNMSAGVDTASWTVAGNLIAVIDDAPADPSNDTVLDVTISGTNIIVYQFKVGAAASIDCSDPTGYSGDVPVGTKITNDISGLAEGNITLCVVGGNGTDWQADADATSYTWVKDTAGPSNPMITINSGDGYTSAGTVSLSLSALDSPVQMYITNTAGCTGSTWESYSTSKLGWGLAQANATATVYAKFKDALGNESSCVSDSITHDSIAPSPPTSPTVSPLPTYITDPIPINFGEPSDTGSGVEKYLVKIVEAGAPIYSQEIFSVSDNLFPPAGTLTDGVDYDISVVAIDFAGNTSAPVFTGLWRFEVKFTQVDAGIFHTCAVTEAGSIYCWGEGADGQLGDGSFMSSYSPVKVDRSGIPPSERFNQVAVGASHTCGLTDSGTAYCWGNDDLGQLGRGLGTGNSGIPYGISYGANFLKISAGDSHTCAIDNQSDVYCWGSNSNGQLGDTTTNDSVDPVKASVSNIVELSAGSDYTCGNIGSGEVYCWGNNDSGQFGNTVTSTENSNPVQAANDQQFISVSAGTRHTCGIDPLSNQGWCWGSNSSGQLGKGTVGGASLSPTSASTTFTQMSSGGSHTCALTLSGNAHCAGDNFYGQLGTGSSSPSNSPTFQATTAAETFTSISSGENHICALTASGEVYCWGDNSAGQVGAPAPATVYTPTLVLIP